MKLFLSRLKKNVCESRLEIMMKIVDILFNLKKKRQRLFVFFCIKMREKKKEVMFGHFEGW